MRYSTLLTDASDEPIIARQETFPAGWDAHHGTVYVLPETLIDDLDACVAAREAEEEESGLAEEEESDGDED